MKDLSIPPVSDLKNWNFDKLESFSDSTTITKNIDDANNYLYIVEGTTTAGSKWEYFQSSLKDENEHDLVYRFRIGDFMIVKDKNRVLKSKNSSDVNENSDSGNKENSVVANDFKEDIVFRWQGEKVWSSEDGDTGEGKERINGILQQVAETEKVTVDKLKSALPMSVGIY